MWSIVVSQMNYPKHGIYHPKYKIHLPKEADLKEQAQLFPCQTAQKPSKLLKLFPHWRPQCTFGTKNSQNSHTGTPPQNWFSFTKCDKIGWKSTFSFQPFHWKYYCRGLRFSTSADLIALVLFEQLPFSWTHFVKSKFLVCTGPIFGFDSSNEMQRPQYMWDVACICLTFL